MLPSFALTRKHSLKLLPVFFFLEQFLSVACVLFVSCSHCDDHAGFCQERELLVGGGF